MRKEADSVHPHACGEYFIKMMLFKGDFGSSPRVWGIQPPRRCSDSAGRFIPTRVGNTPSLKPLVDSGTVHPHACGEYPVEAFDALIDLRFIPTRVGNTDASEMTHAEVAVHPHACGEYA